MPQPTDFRTREIMSWDIGGRGNGYLLNGLPPVPGLSVLFGV